MSKDIEGVPLDWFETPVEVALRAYNIISEGKIEFEYHGAGKLDRTPERSNSARSVSKVLYCGENVGLLYTIAFKPGDGTGTEADYKLRDLIVEPPYPTKTCVVPRNKTGVHHEAHLTIVSHRIDHVHANPVLFKGQYDLLGISNNNHVSKIGELRSLKSQTGFAPTTTLTVGYNEQNQRFGDRHSVYSELPGWIQVCAFLAINTETHQQFPHLLDILEPRFPTP